MLLNDSVYPNCWFLQSSYNHWNLIIGEMITASEAESRRKVYEQENKGCYIYDGVMAPNGKAMRYVVALLFLNETQEPVIHTSYSK